MSFMYFWAYIESQTRWFDWHLQCAIIYSGTQTALIPEVRGWSPPNLQPRWLRNTHAVTQQNKAGWQSNVYLQLSSTTNGADVSWWINVQCNYLNSSSWPPSVIAACYHHNNKTHRGHRVASGMSRPVRQQSVSVCCVCVRWRVNMPTFTSSLGWILSLLPSTAQLFYVCLLFQRLSWLPHTHRRSERWGHQCFRGGRWMRLTHPWERHIMTSSSAQWITVHQV